MATDIERVLRAAREQKPDVYERADAIARIIDPSAYLDDWVVHGASVKLLNAKVKYRRAAALTKALDILAYLGMSTETDWEDVFQRLAKETRGLAQSVDAVDPHGPVPKADV